MQVNFWNEYQAHRTLNYWTPVFTYSIIRMKCESQMGVVCCTYMCAEWIVVSSSFILTKISFTFLWYSNVWLAFTNGRWTEWRPEWCVLEKESIGMSAYRHWSKTYNNPKAVHFFFVLIHAGLLVSLLQLPHICLKSKKNLSNYFFYFICNMEKIQLK